MCETRSSRAWGQPQAGQGTYRGEAGSGQGACTSAHQARHGQQPWQRGEARRPSGPARPRRSRRRPHRSHRRCGTRGREEEGEEEGELTTASRDVRESGDEGEKEGRCPGGGILVRRLAALDGAAARHMRRPIVGALAASARLLRERVKVCRGEARTRRGERGPGGGGGKRRWRVGEKARANRAGDWRGKQGAPAGGAYGRGLCP